MNHGSQDKKMLTQNLFITYAYCVSKQNNLVSNYKTI